MTKWTKLALIGLKWTKVDLIGPNSNCLIFRKNKLPSKNFREKIIHYIQLQNNYFATSINIYIYILKKKNSTTRCRKHIKKEKKYQTQNERHDM